jgi:hypothetical protein
MTKDEVTKALRRAYNLGQIYWQQADSEYMSQHKKADQTEAKFQELLETTSAALEAKDEPDHSDELTIAYMSGLHRGKEVAQRTWVGLSDDEVDQFHNWKDCTWSTNELVRYVEARLKEKNT